MAKTTPTHSTTSPVTVPTPQSSGDSHKDAMLATMNQIANLLSGLQKQLPSTNNQLWTSSNPKTHATVHDGQIVTKTVQRRAPGNTGTKGIQTTGSGVNNLGKKWYHDKALLMQAKEKGVVLDADAEAFLADVECTALYDQPLALTTTNLFEANHEDAYDFDVDKGPHASAAFLANLSSTCGINGSSSSHINEEEHLNSEVDSVLDDNMITYDEYQNDFGVEAVPTVVSVNEADKQSMIAVLQRMHTEIAGYALETELTQLKDTVTSLKIHNDRYKETPKPSPRFTRKPVAPLLKKPNVNVPLSTGIKSAIEASKPASKSNAWIYKKLPAKRKYAKNTSIPNPGDSVLLSVEYFISMQPEI
nr:hypothetical protein [Tanacetum cinerariifolium]